MKDTLAMVCFLNKDNKLLIAKSDMFEKEYTLPCVKLSNLIEESLTPKNYYNVVKMCQKELGIDPQIIGTLEMTKGIYKNLDTNEYKPIYFMCMVIKETENYIGKPKLIPEPVIFRDQRYVSYKELIELNEHSKVNNQTLMYAHDVFKLEETL